MSESKFNLRYQVQELEELRQRYGVLVAEAAPVIAVLAYKGGSMFAKAWVEEARSLGFHIEEPPMEAAQTEDAE